MEAIYLDIPENLISPEGLLRDYYPQDSTETNDSWQTGEALTIETMPMLLLFHTFLPVLSGKGFIWLTKTLFALSIWSIDILQILKDYPLKARIGEQTQAQTNPDQAGQVLNFQLAHCVASLFLDRFNAAVQTVRNFTVG